MAWLALIGLIVMLLGFTAAVAQLLDFALRLVVRRAIRHAHRR